MDDKPVKQNKVFGLLGFAARARKLVTGYNTCLKMIPSGKIKLLILGEDVGDATKEKMNSKCDTYDVPIRIYGTCEELSHITGKENKGIFGITDQGFAKSIAEKIDKEKESKEVL